MAKLSVHPWIGNAAAARSGRYGAVTSQTREAGCSRQTAYDHHQRVTRAVLEAQARGPSRTELLPENQRLRAENRQLWAWLDPSFACPKAKRRPFAVQAAAAGLSRQQTRTLLAVLLPAALLPSRATLGRWVQHDARRAGHLLRLRDAACRTLVVGVSLDDIFFRRQPVLLAVEPVRWAWLVGQRSPDRSGPAWAQVGAAWPALTDVAADGGSGIELGIALTVAQRQEAARRSGDAPLGIRVRLDAFHTQRAGARALRAEWVQAERLGEAAENIERAKQRFDRGGGHGCPFNQAVVRKAWAPAEAAFPEAEPKEQAWRRAVAALGVFRPDGRLKEPAWAAAALQAAAAALTGTRGAQVRRRRLDPRTRTFRERRAEALAVAEPCPERRQALASWWRARQAARRARGEATAAAEVPVRLWEARVARLGMGADAYERVRQALRGVLRARRAVEGRNRVVRLHQARHRPLSQELLDRKRLSRNILRSMSA